ncbi:MAG: hypothetical protein K1W22_10220 [Lachnospiraceae bacterium]
MGRTFSVRLSTCKRCGRKITWRDTRAGKKMPCDPEVICFVVPEDRKGAEKFLTQNGDIVSADRVYGGVGTQLGFVPHFATCEKEQKKSTGSN